MKKFIAILLCLFMMLPLFAGCSKKSETPPATGSDLANAKAYLVNMYQPDSKDEVVELLADKDVLATVTVDGVSYTVTWTVTVVKGASDSVKISESETANCVKIDIPDLPEEDIEFTATATVKDKDGKTESANFNYMVKGIIVSGLTDAEVVEQAYELAEGETLEDEATITGVITAIQTPWNETDKNISVMIQVGDMADKPLLCVGLQGEGADALVVGDTITVIGMITNNAGSVEFKTGCTLDEVISGSTEDPEDPEQDPTGTDDPTTSTTVPSGTTTKGPTTTTTKKPSGGSVTPPSTMTGIVDAAYALEDGESLPYTATLTGKVIAVNEAYDEEFDNITVTIQVAGREDKPIKCYRLKGNGVDKIVKNDTLTVTGTLKSHYGTIEFDLGCTLDKRVASQTTIKQETDPEKIVAAAFALSSGEDLGYDVTLTGKVSGIKTPYDPSYQNISVYITVAGKELLCYRLTGTGIDKVTGGDTITVTGRIKNYNGTIEFDQGCVMRKRVSGGVVVPTDPAEIIEAAFALEPGKALPYSSSLTGKIISVDTEYSSQYNNITVTIVVTGFDDKPIKCYRMKGDGADALKVGDVITVTGVIKNYQHSSGDCEVEFDSGCTFVK